MKSQKSENEIGQGEMFNRRLESFLNLSYELIQLSRQIDWRYFEQQFGMNFNDRGRPALPTRWVVALTYLKQAYNLSDEALVLQFLENPYWQYFCGFEYFQHRFPCDSSSLTRWRKRLGEEGCNKLLSETLRVAHGLGQVKVKQMTQVVDTTAQEKNITHPTDAKLLNRARVKLVMAAKERNIELRQSYHRVGKSLLLKQAKYVHAKQFRRAHKATRKLRTLLGRVMRDIRRKCSTPDPTLMRRLDLCRRLYWQRKDSKHKLYSLHEPTVACIAKGKAHKPYEFGCKTSIVKTASNNWVLGVKSFLGNPYDGSTLKVAIAGAQATTGIHLCR